MIWIAVAVAALAACALGITYTVYRIAFYSSPKRRGNCLTLPQIAQYAQAQELMRTLMDELAATAFEPVRITSFDGVPLAGKYRHVRDGAPVQIEFHGYRGSGERDFCGGDKLAREMGHNTLLVDQRAHGESGGRTITFGVRERLDCLAWVQYVCDRFGGETPVILSGISMGATTVLMASELELPKNVAAIIADCPFSSPQAIIRKVCKTDMHLPAAAAMFFVRLAARLFGRFRLDAADAVDAIRHTNIPILLLHGEADSFVPCEMSGEIRQAAAGPVVRATFPGADHGMSYVADTPRYVDTVKSFIADALRR